MFKKFKRSEKIFALFVLIFLIGMSFAVKDRGGKDLKIFLFGLEQTKKYQSPYERYPGDTDRPLYRYAPGFLVLQAPYVLKSKNVSPLEFSDLEYEDIEPSVMAWYLTEVLALFMIAWFLWKFFPSLSNEADRKHMMISFLLAVPMIGYEISNCQSKLVAMALMLAALFFFEKNRMLLSAFFFNWAMTVYIPLVYFLLYFLIKNKKGFLLSFVAMFLFVFFLIPSLVFGFEFNIFLLKQWFLRCIKPFAFATSYESYTDLRVSSQSLPSALGRIFVYGKTGSFHYLISPVWIHWIIKIVSAFLVLVSCWAVWKNRRKAYRGLGYLVFFLLAMLIPQYTLTYTWAWMFVFSYVILSLSADTDLILGQKKFLLVLLSFVFVSISLVGVRFLSVHSLLFWSTLFLWGGSVFILARGKRGSKERCESFSR